MFLSHNASVLLRIKRIFLILINICDDVQVLLKAKNTKAYLGPSQTSMTETFARVTPS